MGVWGMRVVVRWPLVVALFAAFAASAASAALTLPASTLAASSVAEPFSAGPTVVEPAVDFTPNGRLGTQVVPLTVSWSAGTPNGSPIYRYELQRSLDTAPWTPVALPSRLARSVVNKLQPWRVIRFRLRAVDTASQAGDWAETSPLWLSAAQEDDPNVDLSAGWQSVADAGSYRGRRATAANSGETATFTFTGRQVAWIARFGPDRGQANVSVDGGPATSVDLHRASTSKRRTVYGHSWPTVETHTLQVTTSTGSAVDVDAFLVLTDPTDQAMIGAGDIANCVTSHDSDTAALVTAALGSDPSTIVFTAGDNVYPQGDADLYTGCYEPTWGSFKDETRPIPGNHDYYQNPGAGPYFAYFGAAAGPPGRGWYSYEAGTWRIYALNSECANGSACYTAQYNWLKADLAAEPHRCVLALWHRPRFSTGPHGSSTRMADFFKLLYDNGAEVVVNGHDHMYERYTPLNASGTPDAVKGIREIVVGTGGASLYAFKTETSVIDVRSNSSYGVLGLSLAPGTYSWEFVPVPGPSGFTDTGTGTCH